MPNLADGTYSIESWDQQPYDNTEPSLVRATVAIRYEGDLQGEGAIQYLMTNLSGGSAIFVGQIRFSGSVGDRRGTMVLHEHGEFTGTLARGHYTVVPGSGTDQLGDISGSGAYMAAHGEGQVEFAGRLWHPTPQRIASYVLDYKLD